MNRRMFVAGCAGLLVPIKAAASQHTTTLGEEGYVYDWANQYTNDPRFTEIKLPSGGRDIHGVWIDGRDVMDLVITHLKTGADGLIEYLEVNKDGLIKVVNDSVVRVTLRGRVRYLPVAGFPPLRKERAGVVETTSQLDQEYRTFSPVGK